MPIFRFSKTSPSTPIAVLVLVALSGPGVPACGEQADSIAANETPGAKNVASTADSMQALRSQIRAAREEIARRNFAAAEGRLLSVVEVAEASSNSVALSAAHRDLAYMERLSGNLSDAANHSHLALVAAQATHEYDSILLLPFLEESILDCINTKHFVPLPAMLEQIILLESKCGAPENASQLANLFQLFRLYLAENRVKEAGEAQERIVKLTKTLYGEKSPKVLTEYTALAQLMFNDNNYGGAETVCQQWLNSVSAQDSAELAKAHFYMGLACHNQRKIDIARKHFQIAWTNSPGPEQKANAGIWLIQIECSKKNYAAARPLAREVYKLAKNEHLTSLSALALEYEASIEMATSNTKVFESLLTQAVETRRRTSEWSLAKADLKKLSKYFSNIGQPAKATVYDVQAAALPQ